MPADLCLAFPVGKAALMFCQLDNNRVNLPFLEGKLESELCVIRVSDGKSLKGGGLDVQHRYETKRRYQTAKASSNERPRLTLLM